MTKSTIDDFQGRTVSIAGTFFDYSRPEFEIILSGHGFSKFANKPMKGHYCCFCADAANRVAKDARDLGIRVIDERALRTFLGPPLSDFSARLRHGFAVQMEGRVVDEKYNQYGWVQTAAVKRRTSDLPAKLKKTAKYRTRMRITLVGAGHPATIHAERPHWSRSAASACRPR